MTHYIRRPNLGQDRGQALIETAIALPLLLLVSVSIFEFGRAYQTSQVITNAAREGARAAVMPGTTVADVKARVKGYMHDGELGNYNIATVTVDQNKVVAIGAINASATMVKVDYPFSFMLLNPVAKLVTKSSTAGGSAIMLSASAQMRNEAQ